MKEERTIELRRYEVATILAKHFGMVYNHPRYASLDGDMRLNAKISWPGSEEKVESKEEKTGMRSKEEIMKEVRGYKEGRDYAQLEVLLNIRDNIDFLARVGR